jgi:GxxExxY protein
MTANEISLLIITESIRIHRRPGPGLYESVYEATPAQDLRARRLRVEEQKVLPLRIQGGVHARGFQADLVVENIVPIEVKPAPVHLRIHTSQMLTYLRSSGFTPGLVLNFGTGLMKQGITRVANGLRA